MPFGKSFNKQNTFDPNDNMLANEEQQPEAAPPAQNPYDRQAFIDAWQNAPTHDAASLQNIASQFEGVNVGGKSGDVLTLPGYTEAGTGIYRGPEQIDAIGDVGGANSWAWTGVGPGAGSGGGGGVGGGVNGALDPGQGGGFNAGGAGVDGALRDALLRLMSRSEPGPIDPLSDPNLGPQARAFQTARQREAQRERAQLAERSAFTGLNSGGQGSGAFNQGLSDISQRAGESISSQQAGLVGQEVQARRSDLMNALQIANAIGARDQAATIQKQLADLDNQFRYAQLGQQQSQFDDRYGLDLAQFENQANRQSLLDVLMGLG